MPDGGQERVTRRMARIDELLREVRDDHDRDPVAWHRRLFNQPDPPAECPQCGATERETTQAKEA